MAGSVGFNDQLAEPFKKIVPVIIVSKYPSAFYSRYDHVVPTP
jgi:hypothetical protein